MNQVQAENRSVFKYNLAFYYQSTIIYFVVFTVYMIIRGEFVDNSYSLVIKDPIIYFFAIVVVISIMALLFNLYRNRHIEFTNDGIGFLDRFRERRININEISEIKISRKRRKSESSLRFVRLKLNTRKRPVIIRISDYENVSELVKKFQQLKSDLETKDV